MSLMSENINYVHNLIDALNNSIKFKYSHLCNKTVYNEYVMCYRL